MTTERVLQRKIIDYLKNSGILVVKVDSTSTRGLPDLLVILPSGEVHFVEIKTKTGKLSVHQQRIHQQLKEQNANVHTVRSLEEVQRLLNP
jgi:Holliday junction resolvase